MVMTERELATLVVATLQRHGHTAVLAGGCVRDELLGREPKDYDVATSARPEVVESIFPHTIAVGKAFGFFGGKTDIAGGIIRAVGIPQERIAEDRLRMLRAPRFAARYGFSIDRALLDALKQNSAQINAVHDGRRAVSFERICNEVEGI